MAVLLALAPFLSTPAKEERIEDNSFLIEEAYNQEPGVLQHIVTFQRSLSTGEWIGTFTEEWPVVDEGHQVSLTATVQRLALGTGSATGFGDLLLNYRHQLYRAADSTAVAVARLSAVLPTGDAGRSLGSGGPGLQLNFPVSVILGPWFTAHWNLGGTWVPSGSRASQAGTHTQLLAGQGLDWLPLRSLNLLVEVLWTTTRFVPSSGGSAERADALVVCPGFRHLVELAREWELVWGLALPVGVGPGSGQRSLMLYLSFEHPLLGS
jgi:hypothetical protein